MFDRLSYVKLLEEKNFKQLQEQISKENEVDIAFFLEELEAETELIVYRLLPKDLAAEVFASLTIEAQQDLVEIITDEELAHIMEEMFLDDAVDFIESLQEEMPASVVKRVLANADTEQRELINTFLQYPKNSAGSLMTIEYIKLNSNITVAEAFHKIKATGLDKETIYTCYVTDASRHLIGYVSVRTLLLADENSVIGDIMDSNIISTNTHTDQDEVAFLFEKYGFISLPVVDNENRLVGIITVDDMIDTIRQAATEDFQKMAAMTPTDKPYLRTPVVELAKNRVGWLMILMVSGLITGTILRRFEMAITAIPLLVSFVPMLTDTGGNSGSQSSTLIIRGLATHELHPKDLPVILFKELRIGFICGGLLAATNFLITMLRFRGQDDIVKIAIVVSLSIWFIVVLSKSIGAVLPVFASVLKLDPAIMAGPLITTIVDALGLLVYFSLAALILSQSLAAFT